MNEKYISKVTFSFMPSGLYVKVQASRLWAIRKEWIQGNWNIKTLKATSSFNTNAVTWISFILNPPVKTHARTHTHTHTHTKKKTEILKNDINGVLIIFSDSDMHVRKLIGDLRHQIRQRVKPCVTPAVCSQYYVNQIFYCRDYACTICSTHQYNGAGVKAAWNRKHCLFSKHLYIVFVQRATRLRLYFPLRKYKALRS